MALVTAPSSYNGGRKGPFATAPEPCRTVFTRKSRSIAYAIACRKGSLLDGARSRLNMIAITTGIENHV